MGSALYAYQSTGWLSPLLVAEIVREIDDSNRVDETTAELRFVLQAIAVGES